MSNSEDLILKKKQFCQSVTESNHFLPSGSISSLNDSIQTDENLLVKFSPEESFTEDEAHISYQVIEYESIMINTNKTKETQTEITENEYLDKTKIQEMNKTIAKLSLECNNYAKYNEDLRKEIITTNHQQKNGKIDSLQEEIKRLKSKLHVHENMIEKVINMVEEICEEQTENVRKSSKIDFHAYNYLMSKLEIVRSRMIRYNTKIQLLESDKNSMAELLNFYISAGMLIETQKITQGLSGNITPECTNPTFSSRKNSGLMENSANTLKKTSYGDDNHIKKPSNSGSDASGNKEIMHFPNTMINLKGISKLTKANNTIKKIKNDISQSISPTLPKQRKNSRKKNISKENSRSNTLRTSKACIEDMKKQQRLRYKS